MTSIDMILRFSWLKKENSNIDWFTRRFRWRFEEKDVDDEKMIANHVSENKIAISRNKESIKSINITMIDKDEFNEICRYENVQACIFEYEKIVQILNRERFVARVITEIENEHKLFKKYQDFANVFDKMNVDKLFEHDFQNHAIETIESKSFSFESIYNLSIIELKTLREYLDEHLKKKFITSSHSSTKISILFVKKLSEDLRLCVDYRRLNAITIKNRYFIFLIMQILICLMSAVIFTKLNIRAIYYAIRIWEENINMTLREFINIFVIIYLDDILIFFKNQVDYVKHVRLILEKLRLYRLFCALHKCKFDMREIDYLRYMIDSLKLRMNLVRIVTITEWSVSKSHKNVQVFINFANFYRRFIRYFSRITADLTNLLKKEKKKIHLEICSYQRD
jgi:hypothetical protein